MYLSKSHGGIYYIWYKDEHGKKQKVSTRTRSKREAFNALADFARLITREPKSIGLSQFKEEFLAYAGSTFSAATADIYRRCLTSFVGIVGDIPLKKITPRHLDEYKVRRLKSVKPVSVNVELRTLKAAFNTARRWKLITENPSSDSPLCSLPEQAPIFFTLDDMRKLMAVIEQPWFKDMIVLAALTGMRRSELANLRWTQVDMERRIIHVETTATFKTKSGRRRTIPMGTSALAIVHSRTGADTSEYVFSENGQQINVQHVTHLFKRYVRAAKLSEQRLHFHSLRHTFASWLVQDGATLYEVQRLLGHSSPRVTEIYSHLLPEHLYGAVERLTLSTN